MSNNALLASDNFASGSLAAGWSATPSQSVCKVVVGPPNFTEANVAGTVAGQVWTGLTWPSDQASEIIVTMTGAAVATTLVQIHVRNQGGATYSGYLAVIKDSGAWEIDVVVAGTPTALVSGNGVTIGTKDVWTFQVAGAVLSLYQNNKRIGYYSDTTYTSGTPGYSQRATTTLSTNEVFSWRGYSVVQQDGIWQRQGVIIPAISGDFTSGAGGQANIAMLHEGNAQILSGTVFKAWFSTGGPNAEQNIYYAESADGVTGWTRYVGAVIANYGSPFIIKNGSTYYLYAQPKASAGVGKFHLFTGTDGLNWADQGVVFDLGTAGQWDDTAMWYFQPITIAGGVWYAVYCATHNTTNYLLSLGLAISADGVTWVREPTNPVLASTPPGGSIVNSQAVAKVGSKWYMWFFGNQPNQQNTSVPYLNPGEGIRYETTDFKTWSNPVHSVHQTQGFEGVNTKFGQSYPNNIFDIGGQAHMYIQSAESDNQSPEIYQISVAIAPVPIASIITTREDGLQPTALENFTSGVGDLGPAWSVPTGATKLQIVSGNLCEGTALSACIECYTGSIFSASQYAEVTLATLANTSNGASPIVRCQTGSIGYYVASLSGALGSLHSGGNNISIYKNVAGVFTAIGTVQLVSYTPSANDVWRLSVVNGSDGHPILTLFQNEFTILQVEDYNDTFMSGYPGIYISPATALANAQIKGWAGGNANVIPTYPSNGLIKAQTGTHFTAQIRTGHGVALASQKIRTEIR